MAKSGTRQKVAAAKRVRKERAMKAPGAQSPYARKRTYLKRASYRESRKVFGFEFEGQKPWKS